MKNLVYYRGYEPAWITYIRARIKANLNFLSITEGPTGVGKSWAMISIAKMLDEDFSIDQVAFTFKEVMEIINADWFKKKKWKVIIFDEAQTDISNRSWQSLTNKLMLYLTSTFRHQNIILFFISPFSDFVDSATMKLIHCKFVVKGHDRNTKITRVRPKLQQYNSKMRKFYEHSLMVVTKKGIVKQTLFEVPKPPKELIVPYEKKKTEFTEKLNREILSMLNKVFAKKEMPEERKELTEQQKVILSAMKEYKVQKKVAEVTGIKPTIVSKQLYYAKKKGYTPENFKLHPYELESKGTNGDKIEPMVTNSDQKE